jgi:lysyl-tRNA synthetase class II
MNTVEYIKNNFKDFYIDNGPENGILHGMKYSGSSTHCRACLNALVRMLKPKTILEIGSWHYESTISMLEEIISERLKKRSLLEGAGTDPYPAKTKRTSPISAILAKWESFVQKPSVTVAGRVYAVRGQGALMFMDVKDELAGIQVVFRQDNAVDAENFALTRDALDIGDFVEASGPLTVTKRGEKSVGPKTKKLLKAKFGTVDSIRGASVDELIKVVGEKMAKVIKQHL